MVTNADLAARYGITTSFGGSTLDPNAIASPCGLMAASMFTDEFGDLVNNDGESYTLSKKNIAYPSDNDVFKNGPNAAAV